jgi:hypothetical protein
MIGLFPSGIDWRIRVMAPADFKAYFQKGNIVHCVKACANRGLSAFHPIALRQ